MEGKTGMKGMWAMREERGYRDEKDGEGMRREGMEEMRRRKRHRDGECRNGGEVGIKGMIRKMLGWKG